MTKELEDMIHKEYMELYGFGSNTMKKIKTCPRCGYIANVSDRFCKECGKYLSKQSLFQSYLESRKHCKKCDSIVGEKANFCANCGANLKEQEE